MSKQITYAEKQGEPPFDWNTFLDRAIAGEISFDEHNEAINLARHWVSCACGNQCDIIPRDRYGNPLDTWLSILGARFSYRVSRSYFKEAKQTLSNIEARSAELIAEIKKEGGHE